MIITPFNNNSNIDYELSQTYGTNTVTGLITPLFRVVTVDSNTGSVLAVNYVDELGAVYVPGINEVVDRNPLRVQLGQEMLTVGLVPVGLGAIPANAAIAELQPDNGAIRFTVSGIDPSAIAGSGFKLSGGGFAQLESRSEVLAFSAVILAPFTTAEVYVHYANTIQHNT